MTTTLLFFLITIMAAAVVIVLAVSIYKKVDKAAEEHGTALEQIEDSLSKIQHMMQDSGDAAEQRGFRASPSENYGIAQTRPDERAAGPGAAFQAENAAGAPERVWAGAAGPSEDRRVKPVTPAAEAEEEFEAIWDSGKTVTVLRVSEKKRSVQERVPEKAEPVPVIEVPVKADADKRKADLTVFPKFRNRDDGTDKFGRVYTLEELRTLIR